MGVFLSELQKSSHWRDFFAFLLLGMLVSVFMGRIVFLSQVMIPIDNLFKLEPWKSEYPASAEIVSQIWNPDMTDEITQGYPQYNAVFNTRKGKGSLLWDPSILTGMPSMARGNLESNPIFFFLGSFLPLEKSVNGTKVLGLLLAGLFTYIFLRELQLGPFGALVGSIAFSYNAYLVSWLSLTFFFSAMIWLPAIFWGIERAARRNDWRWSLAGGLGFTLQIMSGSILFAFFSAVTLLLFYAFRSISEWITTREIKRSLRPGLYMVIALVFGALLAAPQLLLAIELYLQTRRDAPIGAGSFLDPGVHLIRLIAPRIYGDNIHGKVYQSAFNFPETNLYVGIIPLFLIPFSFAGPNRKTAWGLLAIGITCLLAVYSAPVRQLVRLIYPLMLHTFPGRIFFIVSFCLSIAAGIGADALSSHLNRSILRGSALAAVFLMVFLLLLRGNPEGFLKGETIYPENLTLPLIWLSFAALLFLIWSFSWRRSSFLKTSALMILIADLFVPGINDNAAFDKALLYPNTESLNFLEQKFASDPQPSRLVTINSEVLLPGNIAEIYGLQTITGYTSWILKRYSEYTSLAQGRYDSLNKISFYNCCDRLLNALNVRYIYTTAGVLPESAGILNLHTLPGKIETQPDIQNAISPVFWEVQGKTEAVLVEIPPSKITYELEAEQGMKLITAVLVDQGTSDQTGSEVRFSVNIQSIGSDQSETFFQTAVNPALNPSDNSPIPVVVDLSNYHGRKIRLTLQTEMEVVNGSAVLAGWVNPRIEGYSPRLLEEIYSKANKVYENSEAYPRAWIVHQIVRVPTGDLQSVKKYLRNPDFNLKTKAVVEARVSSVWVERYAPIDNYPDEQARITNYTSGEVRIQAKLVRPGMLVLSDMMYPGWKVYVDGVRHSILTTNMIMRGVVLTEGEHLVIFRYAPDLFLLGWFLVVLAILVAAVLLYLSFRPVQSSELPPSSKIDYD